jgi:hypothetical protein
MCSSERWSRYQFKAYQIIHSLSERAIHSIDCHRLLCFRVVVFLSTFTVFICVACYTGASYNVPIRREFEKAFVEFGERGAELEAQWTQWCMERTENGTGQCNWIDSHHFTEDSQFLSERGNSLDIDRYYLVRHIVSELMDEYLKLEDNVSSLILFGSLLVLVRVFIYSCDDRPMDRGQTTISQTFQPFHEQFLSSRLRDLHRNYSFRELSETADLPPELARMILEYMY